MRYELKSLGIQVAIVEPGVFETDIWTRNAKLSALMLDPDSPNAARVPRWRSRVQGDRKRADPQVVADVIAAVVENSRPKLRYPVGTDARMGLLMSKLLPRGVFERFILKATGMDQ